MNALEILASGNLPEKFPYKYESAFDPVSPWSLILALYPESSGLNSLEFPISDSETAVIDKSIADFVEGECSKLKWQKEKLGNDSINSYFLKTRLRQTDEACRQLIIPVRMRDIDEDWIDGTVRVLRLWRHLNGDSTEPSLAEFEQWSPDVVFNELIEFEPFGWDLRQRLEFLVLPYLKYKSRIDLLQSWVAGAENLDDVRSVVFAPELVGPLLQVCLNTGLEDWRVVKATIDVIKPVESGEKDVITLETLNVPSQSTVEFIFNLVSVAKLGKIQASKFQQLAQWSLGSASLQEDVLIRLLESNSHLAAHDISLLCKTVLCKLDDSLIWQKVIRAALHKSRFMFIKSHALSTRPQLVKAEVMSLVSKFEQLSPDVQLSQVVMGLELVEDEPLLLAKYKKLDTANSLFDIDPKYALTHNPLENVAKALESNNDAYLRYTELVRYVGGEENSSAVAEQCIEAALADDNFDAVVEFIDRGFITKESPSAWLAYYQAGKYISPGWDLPRDSHILELQLDYLSTALSLCPEGDLLTVLRTWSATDQEAAEVRADKLQTQAGIDQNVLSSDIAKKNLEGADESQPSAGARDHISNLLVSGIGWAIGANQ